MHAQQVRDKIADRAVEVILANPGISISQLAQFLLGDYLQQEYPNKQDLVQNEFMLRDFKVKTAEISLGVFLGVSDIVEKTLDPSTPFMISFGDTESPSDILSSMGLKVNPKFLVKAIKSGLDNSINKAKG